jgi:hypothetical protein
VVDVNSVRSISNPRVMIGAIAVGVVFFLYVLLVGVAMFDSGGFSASMATVLAAVTGVVSAFVAAELAVTPPKEWPTGRTLTGDPHTKSGLSEWTTWVCLGVWLVVGAVALLWWLFKSDANAAVGVIGKAWLGVMVASACAYLGVKPAGDDG